ncbi:MAG: tetratricopeptide repeat protein [Nibricoccus sp.]
MQRNYLRVGSIVLVSVIVCIYTACSSLLEDPSRSDEWLEKGDVYEKAGKHELALKCYDKAVRLNPGHTRGYSYRAQAKLELHDFKGAIDDYTKAIALRPRDPFYYTHRGIARRKAQDFEGARADCLRAVEIDDKDPLAYRELGNIAKELEKYSEASRYYTQAIEADPDSKSVYVLYWSRGLVELELKQYDASRRDFMKARELKPEDGQTWCNLGNLELELGNSREAIRAFEEALKRNPKLGLAFNNLGIALMVSGQFDKAVEQFTKAIEIKSSGLRFTNRGAARLAVGKYDQAMADFEEALKIEPNNGYPRFYLVLILRLQKKGQGVEELDTVLKKSEDAWEKQIAGLLLGSVSRDAMLAEANKNEPHKIAAKKCDVYYYSGMLHLIAGEKDQARESFKQCLMTECFSDVVYILAAAELKRLG